MYKFGFGFTREGSRAALAVARSRRLVLSADGVCCCPGGLCTGKESLVLNFPPEKVGRTSSLTTRNRTTKVKVNGVHALWISDGHRPDERLHLRDGHKRREESERCCASENVFVLISGLPDRRALQDTERRDGEDFCETV